MLQMKVSEQADSGYRRVFIWRPQSLMVEASLSLNCTLRNEKKCQFCRHLSCFKKTNFTFIYFPCGPYTILFGGGKKNREGPATLKMKTKNSLKSFQKILHRYFAFLPQLKSEATHHSYNAQVPFSHPSSLIRPEEF